MQRRLSMVSGLRSDQFQIVEAALIGTFFIQALRFLVGSLYARIASASQFPALDPALIDETLFGLVEPATVSNEVFFLVYALALSLIAVIAGRFRVLILIAAALAAAGRYLMLADIGISATIAAGLVVGGGLLYIAMVARHRLRVLPYFFVIALAADQLFRAAGNTLDPSWSSDYAPVQIGLSIIAIALAAWNLFGGNSSDKDVPKPQPGMITFWGGIGMGGLLFLQLSLLALPNAILARSGAGYPAYPIVVPALVAATLLPLIPWIRARARYYIGLFDSGFRGWVWMLVIALLLVVGLRLQALATIALLVLAQFAVTMVWWWLARPQATKERNFSGLWVIAGMLLFGVLVVFDNFTYEYAFVQDFTPELDVLNPVVPPLLRGFRGLGLAVILLSVFFACLPMVRTQRRIPWQGGSAVASLAALIVTIGASIGGFIAAQPPVIAGLFNPQELRIGTYNIHAGYNEFYHYDMNAIARTIQQSGAQIIMLQEIEAGRLSSFGVDQPLWLARRLQMDVRYFPTNEGLQGLAVLSRLPIGFDDGELLTSVGTQTGIQRVQMEPAPGEPVITVYNTWLGVLLDTGGTRTVEEQQTDQRAQLEEIFAIIATHTTGDQLFRSRTVFGGTFNNVPDSPLIREVTSIGGNPPLFTDPFAGLPPDLTYTLWRTGQRARLDYLFITRGLAGFGAQAIDTNASDHRMAVIGVTLQ